MSAWLPLFEHQVAAPLRRTARLVADTAVVPHAQTLVPRAPDGVATHVGLFADNGHLDVVVTVVERAGAVWVGRLDVSANTPVDEVSGPILRALLGATNLLAERPLCIGQSSNAHWDQHGFESLADGTWRSRSSSVRTLPTFAFPLADTLDDNAGIPALPLAVGMGLGDHRFVIDGFLGRGAMGEVWSAVDRRLGSSVALKVMRAEFVDHSAHVARFDQEVRVTAQLHHPAVVSVVDAGRLRDGRPWYAMDLVRGQYLRTIARLERPESAEADPAGAAGWVRRTASTLLVVARAVASAHARRVVHRDIKPANIMLGPFGQVLLMDWGVARNMAETDAHEANVGEVVEARSGVGGPATRMGQRVGTPAYMAPEQARGAVDEVGPPADVFALGMTLFEVLVGRLPPRLGLVPDVDAVGVVLKTSDVPDLLTKLLRRMLAVETADRPTAAQVADHLQAFLDGSARRERAEDVYRAAMALAPEAERRHRDARALADKAAAMLAVVPSVGPAEPRKPAWRVEAEGRAVEREAVAIEQSVEQQLRSALELWDGHRGARAGLVALYSRRLLQAERARDAHTAHAAETMLRRLDDPAAHRFLEAHGAVTLLTDPPGARVTAHRLGDVDRRLVPVETVDLGTTPLRAVPLLRGSWMLQVQAPGRQLVRYPVYVERGEHWHGVAPGDTEPTVIHLPPEGLLQPDELYVPAGWFIAGGDPSACESVSRRRLWVDAMVVRKHLLTVAEWWAWRQADPDGIHPDTITGWGERYLDDPPIRREGDRFYTNLKMTERVLGDRYPATAIGALNAQRLARWVAAQSRPRWQWQVPTEWMWEKAARGVDGRFYPWGNRFDPGYCNSIRVPGKPEAVEVGAQPLDVGPYGLVGAAGQYREVTSTLHSKNGDVADGQRVSFRPAVTTDPNAWYITRGGSHFSNPVFCRLAGRFVVRPLTATSTSGVRLFAPYRRPG